MMEKGLNHNAPYVPRILQIGGMEIFDESDVEKVFRTLY